MRLSERAMTTLGAAVILAVLSAGTAFASWNESFTGGSAMARANPGPAPPPAPNATCTSSLTINVAFTAVPYATSYSIYYSGSANGTYIAMATGVTSSPYTALSLIPGSYYFEVAAVEGPDWSSANSPPSSGHTISSTGCT